MRIKFTLPLTEQYPHGRAVCPYCGSLVIGNHQNLVRKIRHHKIAVVYPQRKYCYGCSQTFRHQPLGISRRHQSATLQAMTVLLYVLGLSYDGVVEFLRALGCGVSKGTVWNNVQRAGERAIGLRRASEKGLVRIAGFDTTIYKVKGKRRVVGLLSNILTGKPIEIEVLKDEKARTIKKQFGDLFKTLGVAVLVTDDAEEMEALRDELGLKRQLCLAHLRKTIVKRGKEFKREVEGLKSEVAKDTEKRLKELLKDCKRIDKLVRDLPKDLSKRLEKIHISYLPAPPPKRRKKASIWYRMRLFTNRLWSRADDILLFKDEKFDGTNNTTERNIGICGKIRYKMMRGLKSDESLKRYLKLCVYLKEKDGVIDTRKLI